MVNLAVVSTYSINDRANNMIKNWIFKYFCDDIRELIR